MWNEIGAPWCVLDRPIHKWSPRQNVSSHKTIIHEKSTKVLQSIQGLHFLGEAFKGWGIVRPNKIDTDSHWQDTGLGYVHGLTWFLHGFELWPWAYNGGRWCTEKYMYPIGEGVSCNKWHMPPNIGCSYIRVISHPLLSSTCPSHFLDEGVSPLCLLIMLLNTCPAPDL